MPSQTAAQVAIDILLDREKLTRTVQTLPRGGATDAYSPTTTRHVRPVDRSRLATDHGVADIEYAGATGAPGHRFLVVSLTSLTSTCRHITTSPHKIGTIVNAALALTHFTVSPTVLRGAHPQVIGPDVVFGKEFG